MNAYYSGKREITLDFDQLVEIENFLEVNGVKHFMKDQFFFNIEKNSSLLNGVVNSIVSKKEQVIIKLNSDEKYFTVTWLPNKEYPKTNDIYNGPWIRGSDNKIGALSFYKRNINN